MARASGSNARFLIQPEDTWGVKNTTPNALVLSNVTTGESLNASSEELVSNAISGHRGISDTRNGTISVTGSLPAELSVGNFSNDLFFYGVLGEYVQTPLTVNGVGKFQKVFKRAKELPSFTIEKGLTDVNQYFDFLGCKINSLQVQAEAQGSLINTTAELWGKSLENKQVPFDDTPIETVHSINSGIDAIQVLEAGSSACYSNVNFTIANGITQQYCLGSKFVTGLPVGKGELTGSVTLYFENNTIFLKWLDEVQTSLDIKIQYKNDSIRFYFPIVKFNGDGVVLVESQDGLTVTYNFRALIDLNTGTDVEVTIVNGNDLDMYLGKDTTPTP